MKRCQASVLVNKCMHLILWPSCWHICWEGKESQRPDSETSLFCVSESDWRETSFWRALCPCVSQALKTSGTCLKILLLRTYLQQSDKHYIYVQRMFITSLIYIKNWKHPKCPIIDDLVNQLLDLYTQWTIRQQLVFIGMIHNMEKWAQNMKSKHRLKQNIWQKIKVYVCVCAYFKGLKEVQPKGYIVCFWELGSLLKPVFIHFWIFWSEHTLLLYS